MSYLPTKTPYQARPYDPRYYQYGAQRRYVQDWRGYPFPPSTAPARELGGPLFVQDYDSGPEDLGGAEEELQANVAKLKETVANIKAVVRNDPMAATTLSPSIQAAWNNIATAAGGSAAPTGRVLILTTLPLLQIQITKGENAIRSFSATKIMTAPTPGAVAPFRVVKTAGIGGGLGKAALLGGALLAGMLLFAKRGKKTSGPRRRRR